MTSTGEIYLGWIPGASLAVVRVTSSEPITVLDLLPSHAGDGQTSPQIGPDRVRGVNRPCGSKLWLDLGLLGFPRRVYFGQELQHGLVEGFRLIQIGEMTRIGDDH